MLTIRYLRVGKKNQPSFKIVVTDKRKPPRGGRFVEILGFYNPLTKKKNVKKDRVLYWISKGAQPSVSIHNLLVSEKIIEGKKVATHSVKKGTSSSSRQSRGLSTRSEQASAKGEAVQPISSIQEVKPAVAIASVSPETSKAPIKNQAASAKEQKA